MSDDSSIQSVPVQTGQFQLTPIEMARAYVNSRVQAPALASVLSDDIKNKVRHADLWLTKFQRVGDLLAYLKRFQVDELDPVYIAMKACGLDTFEDIVVDFEKKFGMWSSDCSRFSDFVIGAEYSAFDILILARNYDTRAGGMFVLEVDGIPAAVVIKANLADGKYPNEWIEKPTRLKYYLKSIRNGDKDDFGEHFKANKAVLGNPGIPIVTFTRASASVPFVFQGVFSYEALIKEDSGAKAFILTLAASDSTEIVADSTYVASALADAIVKATSSSRDARLARLALAPKKPSTMKVLSLAFSRNADVIVEVLQRAAGNCEACMEAAPFTRAKDGTPYLEVHHRIPLSECGEDTVENALALCPNCHREQHFGIKKVDPLIDPIHALSTEVDDSA
jgi:5-methylcytosine-specific restriction protein A